MTASALRQLNEVRAENRRLKEENEYLRRKVAEDATYGTDRGDISEELNAEARSLSHLTHSHRFAIVGGGAH